MDDDAFELAYDDIDDLDIGIQEDRNENFPPDEEHLGANSQQNFDTRVNQAIKRSNLPLGKDPLDWFQNIGNDDDLIKAKRRKLEEEKVMNSVTQRIEEAKRKRLMSHSEGIQKEGESSTDSRSISKTTLDLLALPPLSGGAWMGISCPWNNSRRYMTLKSKPKAISSYTISRLRDKSKFYEMLEEVKMEMKESIVDSMPVTDSLPVEEMEQHGLWVDKHAPKTYFQLLTDDETNRLVLLWLKLWDEYVFGRKFRYDSLGEKIRKVLEIEETNPCLPKLKILMIHGPPGIGKTALANIIAKQAGYSPFLINMNEIQNLADLKRRLNDVCNFQTIDQFRRDSTAKNPRCVIIDGIEFAISDCVKYLAQIALKPEKSFRRRPIICTCNNLYSLNLKEMRPACLTLKANLASKERIIKRLTQICKAEGIPKLDSVALEHLIEGCRSDIRLILNTLQFHFQMYARKFIQNGDAKIQEGSIDKFQESSTFELLDAVLTLNFHSDNRGLSRTITERCKTIQKLLSHRDDLDRFMFIVFQNMSFQLGLEQIFLADENFVLFDMNNKFIYAYQCYHLLKFLYIFVAKIHIQVAIHLPKRNIYNLKTHNITEKEREYSLILTNICDRQGKSVFHLTKHDLVLNTLPLLLPIIQSFQPTNSQVFNKKDLQTISKIVSLMANYGLTYVQRYENNMADLQFDPAIDLLVCFPYEQFIRPQGLTYATKKFIAQQIEMYKIRSRDEKSDYHVDYQQSMECTDTGSSSKKNFGFHYNQGSSQTTRRNIRMDKLFF